MVKKLWMAAFAALVVLAPARSAVAQTVEEVLDKHYEAMGGVEAWAATRTMRLNGTISLANGTMEGPISIVQMRPDKSHTLVTVMGMDVVQAYDGEKAWMINPQFGPGPVDADPVTAAALRDQSDFDGPLIGWREKGHQVELVGTETVDGTETIKLQVTLAHGSVSVYYLDADSYLPIKLESRTEGVASTAVMTDYRQIGGLQIPFVIEIDGPMGRNVLTFDSVEVNVEVDESLFSMPGLMLPAAGGAQETPALLDAAFSQLFNEQCAVCHGENLLGAAQGTPLVGNELIHGDAITNIAESIANGFPEKGMPPSSETLSATQIRTLAIYISERRLGFDYLDFKIEAALALPEGHIESEVHGFRLETVIDSLDPLPYSIAPLPDGRILLTEKMRGLSIISQDGEQSDLIKGAPRTYDDTSTDSLGLRYGLGWMMDVAIHPDYETNGWIYIQYGDRCSDCNTISRRFQLPVSMNKLVRGRIKDGTWVDEETLWEADIETYGPFPDIAAGGRISFDHSGHVFISVGMNGIDNHTGIQDLNIPYGKIHRMYDDGGVPPDNPFTGVADAINTIWTYGHRSPQGLEFNLQTGQLWGTEMGPRGGDEVNLLLPGRNYGWPLYSKGMNYDGTPVDYGKKLGIEFELKDIEQPVVDLTPSPAISSFIFYSGTAFPKWRNNIIVGSLKAASLYRMEIENNKVVHTEMLLKDLARFRDIETGPSGEIYVLLEHAMGGQIIRLVPSVTLPSPRPMPWAR